MNLLGRYRLLFILMNTGFIGNLTVIYYLSKGITYGQIGLVSAISALGFFLFEVPTGVVADKVSRKTSVLIGMALFSLGTVILILLQNFPMLIAYAVISSLGATFVSGSLQAWLFDNLKHIGMEKRYREVMKNVKTLTLIFSAFSISIGAFLAQLYGFTLPLVMTLIMELGALLTALSIPEYEFKKPEVSYHLHVLHSARELLRADLLPLVLISIAVTMSINQFRQFFEPYLGEILARGLETTLMGTLGLLGIVEVVIKTLPRLIGIRLGKKWSVRAYEAAPLAIPVFTALSVLFQNPLFIVLLGVLATIVNTAFGFNVSIEFQHRIPSEKRATVLSLEVMFSAVVMALFYTLYGFAVDRFGLSEARLLFAVVLFGIGLAFKLASLGPLREPLELRYLAE
ncbi:MFS transporter [Thermococcus indicus]|uniref:MFS transporter n=1 Tax=Thermococcus indicus TaxID=2586643 RepID=A0A4Y5SN54_9EURY|nr:MFS transporter [Thermococcus indicus]QDA31410.1 MFS transporter [Thermococcus indicus]